MFVIKLTAYRHVLESKKEERNKKKRKGEENNTSRKGGTMYRDEVLPAFVFL